MRGERRERQGRRPPKPSRGCEPAPEVEYVLPEAARGSDTDRIVAAIGVVATAVDNQGQQVVAAIKGSTGPIIGLNPSIAAVYGRNQAMAVNVPVPQLLDTEKITLSVMPRKANGHVDADAVISWVSSDPSQGEAIPGTESFVFTDPQFSEDVTCPGAFNCTATTPGTSGTFSVTASASGYESAEFGPIAYAPGVARSLNASVGSPIADA